MVSGQMRNLPLVHKPTVLERLKNFDVQGLMSDIKAARVDWVELGAFFAVGCLSGFLFRRYFKSFLFFVILTVILIGSLDHFGWVHINWNVAQNSLGVQPAQSFDTLTAAGAAWLKANVTASIGFVGGFIMGYKVG